MDEIQCSLDRLEVAKCQNTPVTNNSKKRKIQNISNMEENPEEFT